MESLSRSLEKYPNGVDHCPGSVARRLDLIVVIHVRRDEFKTGDPRETSLRFDWIAASYTDLSMINKGWINYRKGKNETFLL